MNLKISGKKFFLFILPAAALFLLFFELQWVLQFVLPEKTVTNWVARNLEKELHVKTVIGEVRFGILPAPSVRIIGLSLMDRNTKTEWLRSGSLEIRLKLLPLLRGQAIPHKLLLKHPHFRVERRKDRRWNLPGSPPSASRQDSASSSLPPFEMAIDSFVVKKASLEILDRLRPEQERRIIIQEMDASFQGLSGNAPIFKIKGNFPHKRFENNTFSAAGRMDLPSGKIDLQHLGLDGDFSLRKMPLDLFRPYLIEYLRLDPLSGKAGLKGHFTRESGGALTLTGELSLQDFQLHLPAYASHPITGGKASISIMLQGDRELIHAKSLKLSLDDLTFWGHGTYRRAESPLPGFGLFLHAAALPLERLRHYVPDRMFSEDFIRPFLAGKATGTLDIPLLEITGNTALPTVGSDRESSRVRLKITFHDLGITPGQDLLPLEKLNGNLTWGPQGLRFENLRGIYGRSLFRNLTGTLTYAEPVSADLQIDGRLNLGEIQQLLLRLPEGDREKLLLTRIPKAGGYADLKIRLQGTGQSTPPLQLTGTADLIHAGLAFTPAPLILSALKGRITFSTDRIEPFRLEGKLNTLPATLQGEIRHLFSRRPIIDVTLTSAPTTKELTRLLPSLENHFEFTEGVPKLTLTAQGPSEALHLEGKIDLTRPALVIPGRLKKKGGVPFLIEFSGRAQKGKGLFLDRGNLTLREGTLAFSGALTPPPGSRLTFAVETTHLPLTSLSEMVPALASQTPGAFVLGKLDGGYRIGRPGSSRLNGRITFQGVNIQFPDAPAPIRKITGTFLFSGEKVQARGIRCRWGGTPVTFDMDLPHRNAPRPEFRIHAPFLNLFQLIHTLGMNRGNGTQAKEDFLRKLDLQATVVLDRIRVDPLKLADLRADLLLKEGVLSITTLTSRGLDGMVKGEGKINLLAAGGPQFTGKAYIFDVSAEKYLQLIPHNRTFYTGEISGSISVAGRLYPDLTKTARQMTGTAHLKIKATKERNYLFQITRDIIQGMEIMLGRKDEHFLIVEHDGMGGDFTLSDGKFHSTNFFINQYHKFDVSGLTLDKLTAAIPIRIKYNVRAAGSFDYINSGINCYIAAEPFSIATKLVRKVPLAGKVLTGKNESLYTAYFRFHGSLAYKDRYTEKRAQLKKIHFQDLPKKLQKALSTLK